MGFPTGLQLLAYSSTLTEHIADGLSAMQQLTLRSESGVQSRAPEAGKATITTPTIPHSAIIIDRMATSVGSLLSLSDH